MSTRSQLHLISVLLKLTALLVFVFEVVLKTASNLGFWLSSSNNWLQVAYIVAGSIIGGVVPMLLTYGVAKAIDLLLSMSDEVHSVALVLQRVRKKQAQKQVEKEVELPHSPDGETAWRPKFKGFRVTPGARIPKHDPLDILFRDKYEDRG